MKKIELVTQMNDRNDFGFSYYHLKALSPIYFNPKYKRAEDAGSYWTKKKWIENISTNFKLEFIYD